MHIDWWPDEDSVEMSRDNNWCIRCTQFPVHWRRIKAIISTIACSLQLAWRGILRGICICCLGDLDKGNKVKRKQLDATDSLTFWLRCEWRKAAWESTGDKGKVAHDFTHATAQDAWCEGGVEKRVEKSVQDDVDDDGQWWRRGRQNAKTSYPL